MVFLLRLPEGIRVDDVNTACRVTSRFLHYIAQRVDDHLQSKWPSASTNAISADVIKQNLKLKKPEEKEKRLVNAFFAKPSGFVTLKDDRLLSDCGLGREHALRTVTSFTGRHLEKTSNVLRHELLMQKKKSVHISSDASNKCYKDVELIQCGVGQFVGCLPSIDLLVTRPTSQETNALLISCGARVLQRQANDIKLAIEEAKAIHLI